MRARIRWALPILAALIAVAGLQVARAPEAAAADVYTLCVGSGTYGDVIKTINPGTFNRYIKAKACVGYNTATDKAWSRFRLTCQTGTADNSPFCDFRGESYHQKLDLYNGSNVYIATLTDEHMTTPGSGYVGTVVWSGAFFIDGNDPLWPCEDGQGYPHLQTNTGSNDVRMGFDGNLYSVPDFFSSRGAVC